MRMMVQTAKFPFQLIYDLVILIVTFLKGKQDEN